MSLPTDTSPRLPDIDWRWALPRIAVLFVATRLLVVAVAVAVEVTQPQLRDGASGLDQRPLLASLTRWDSAYFLGIAESGYHADPSYGPDYAFYPLYPMAIRAASLLTLGDTAVAGVLVANIAFALALVLLYALSVRYLTPARALLSLWFLSLAPGAAAFTLAYADSLFLLLAVGVFLAAELRRPWVAGIALALASITRAPGLLLILPVLVLYIERDGWRPTRAWIPLALAPLALAGFFAYTWWLTGDPIAPISAYEYWAAGQAAVGAGDSAGGAGPVNPSLALAPQGEAVLLFASVAFYIFLFVFFRHSPIRRAYWLVAVLAVLGIAMSSLMQSALRYLAVAWPFSWALASRRSRVGQAAVLIGFATIQVVFLWHHFIGQIAP